MNYHLESFDPRGKIQWNPRLPHYSGCLVLTADGRILGQLRDDKPEIIYPGHWTCTPGGHIEPLETPGETIERELYEEFEIEVAPVLPLSKIVLESGPAPGIYFMFHGRMVTPLSEVRCHEGQRAEFFTLEEALDLKQHPLSRDMVQMLAENPLPALPSPHSSDLRL